MVQSATKQAETMARGRAEVYRVEVPMMVLALRNNHHAAVTIQAGEILEVLGRAEDDRFVVAETGEEKVLVFERDLKARGKPVAERKAGTRRNGTSGPSAEGNAVMSRALDEVEHGASTR